MNLGIDLRAIFGDMWSRINRTDPLRTRQYVPKRKRKAVPHVNHQARYKLLRRMKRKTHALA